MLIFLIKKFDFLMLFSLFSGVGSFFFFINSLGFMNFAVKKNIFFSLSYPMYFLFYHLNYFYLG